MSPRDVVSIADMGVADGVLWETCAVDECRGARLGADGHCLLHCSDEALGVLLPKTSSAVDLDGRGVAFDERSLARVLDAIASQADGRRWIGSARFDGASFRHEVTFDGSTFAGPASFAGATFAADARFGGASFLGDVSFDSASFGGQAWFVGAGFRGSATFAAAGFAGPAWFQRTTFEAGARFDRATFTDSVTFSGAAFATVSSFSGTEFQSLAVFDKATFGATSDWAGARFTVEGQGPPAAASPVPEKPPPSMVGGQLLDTLAKAPHPARPVRARRSRPDGSRLAGLLLPLLAVAAIAAAGFIILRPQPRQLVADESIATTTSIDDRSSTGQIVGTTVPRSTTTTAPLEAKGDVNAFKLDPRVTITGKPPRYNPCAPIRYVVNPEGAPANWKKLLDEAIAEVSKPSGLTFEMVSQTDETAIVTDSETPSTPGAYEKTIRRRPFQPDRYAGGWAPILIYWADIAAGPNATAGAETTGIGGSELRWSTDGSPVYVTGVIVVNRKNDPALVKSVLMHELGHVVGLDHVDDPDQVMTAVHDKPVRSWGAGDLTGLSKVGRSAGCINPPLPSSAPQAPPTQPTVPTVPRQP